MTAYLLYGPRHGQFIQVDDVNPPKMFRFPVQDSLPPGVLTNEVTTEATQIKVAEYYLDAIRPWPPPRRGRIATYRFRQTKENP